MVRNWRGAMLKAAALMVLASWGGPALADKLVFDHRLAPALKAVLDGGDAAMIDYDASNPRNIADTIAVRGKSAHDWAEALVIVSRVPDRKIRSAEQWRAALEGETTRRCASTFQVIAQDAGSITFERQSNACPAGYPVRAIYRVMAGKGALFMLAVLAKDDLAPTARAEWLAMMASARIE